jgi:cysteine synthase A
MKVVCSAIGNTPLIELDGIKIKLETANLTGSVKDRMAKYILEKAGLKKGSLIIEATSGNTGIAFAALSAIYGYRFIAVMSEGMSIQRRKMIEAFGAELVLTPAKDDIAGALKKYEELVNEHPDAFLPKQFDNPDNIEAHRQGLGKEIVSEIKDIDVFVAGMGTGGTLIGVAKALKEKYPNVKIVGVEPAESAIFNGEKAGLHKIQGIGEGFVPKIVSDNLGLIDEVIAVKSDDAVEMSNKLAKEHGLLVGISSGANFLAALQLKKKYMNVVTLFPDRGERYLSVA